MCIDTIRRSIGRPNGEKFQIFLLLNQQMMKGGGRMVTMENNTFKGWFITWQRGWNCVKCEAKLLLLREVFTELGECAMKKKVDWMYRAGFRSSSGFQCQHTWSLMNENRTKNTKKNSVRRFPILQSERAAVKWNPYLCVEFWINVCVAFAVQYVS